MTKSNSINKLESMFNKILSDSQSRYEDWLLSAATYDDGNKQIDDQESAEIDSSSFDNEPPLETRRA